jgi:hypothetical protein
LVALKELYSNFDSYNLIISSSDCNMKDMTAVGYK